MPSYTTEVSNFLLGELLLTTAVSYRHSFHFWVHYSCSFQGSTVLILSKKCIFYKSVFVTTRCCRVRLTHQHNSAVTCVRAAVQLTAIQIAGRQGEELQSWLPLGWDRWKKLNAEKHSETPTNTPCTTTSCLKHLANSQLGKQEATSPIQQQQKAYSILFLLK